MKKKAYIRFAAVALACIVTCGLAACSGQEADGPGGKENKTGTRVLEEVKAPEGGRPEEDREPEKDAKSGAGEDRGEREEAGVPDLGEKEGEGPDSRRQAGKEEEECGMTLPDYRDSKISEIDPDFYICSISDKLFERMYGLSYKENCTVPREELRYLHVLHKNLEGETLEGEMVVNKVIAETVLEILKELYDSDYPIERMVLVDDYGADDETSMRANNSSSFNFRFISHTTTISKHGRGLAVDINTLYNPYIKTLADGTEVLEPATAGEYVDRTKDFPYKIDENDLCYKLFTKKGFEWGGNWERAKDYQHFEMPDSFIEALDQN